MRNFAIMNLVEVVRKKMKRRIGALNSLAYRSIEISLESELLVERRSETPATPAPSSLSPFEEERTSRRSVNNRYYSPHSPHSPPYFRTVNAIELNINMTDEGLAANGYGADGTSTTQEAAAQESQEVAAADDVSESSSTVDASDNGRFGGSIQLVNSDASRTMDEPTILSAESSGSTISWTTMKQKRKAPSDATRATNYTNYTDMSEFTDFQTLQTGYFTEATGITGVTGVTGHHTEVTGTTNQAPSGASVTLRLKDDIGEEPADETTTVGFLRLLYINIIDVIGNFSYAVVLWFGRYEGRQFALVEKEIYAYLLLMFCFVGSLMSLFTVATAVQKNYLGKKTIYKNWTLSRLLAALIVVNQMPQIILTTVIDLFFMGHPTFSGTLNVLTSVCALVNTCMTTSYADIMEKDVVPDDVSEVTSIGSIDQMNTIDSCETEYKKLEDEKV